MADNNNEHTLTSSETTMTRAEYQDLVSQLRTDFTESECAVELLDAARYNDIDVCRAILQVHPHLISSSTTNDSNNNNNSNTPLHMAAANGHVPIVQFLTELDPSLVTVPNNMGNTPLHWAASNGQLDVVKLLLKLPKVDVLVKNHAGHSILTEAFLSKNEDLIQMVLEHESATEERLVASSSDSKESTITHDFVFGKNNKNKTAVRARELAMAKNGDDAILGQEAGQNDTTGFSIWASSIVLAHWMVEYNHDDDYGRCTTVLELGAGCGLPGLVVAAATGGSTSVLLSDFNPTAVDNLSHNIQMNHLQESVQAIVMNWQDPSTYPTTTIDVIIGSDLIYQSDMVDMIMNVLETLCPSCFLYVASNCPRQGHDEFIARLSLLFSIVQERPAPPSYQRNPLQSQDDDICFLHFNELQSSEFTLYEFRSPNKEWSSLKN